MNPSYEVFFNFKITAKKNIFYKLRIWSKFLMKKNFLS